MQRPDYETLFADHRPHLWGLCYRITGCAADADEVVQDTFARALEQPPADPDASLRPWLVRIATRRSIDVLRKRKTESYSGPWLPSPVETDPPSYEPTLKGASTAGRYELMECVSYAFLLALEALSPQQRAVFLLRDMFGYSARETADALGLTETNTKTLLHRARRTMSSHDKVREARTPDLAPATKSALDRMLQALGSRNHDAIHALLAEQVRCYTDAGGEFLAAHRPIEGRDDVLRFMTHLAHSNGMPTHTEPRYLNGLPAYVMAYEAPKPRVASRFVVRVELDARLAVREIHVIMATRKLTALGKAPSFGRPR